MGDVGSDAKVAIAITVCNSVKYTCPCTLHTAPPRTWEMSGLICLEALLTYLPGSTFEKSAGASFGLLSRINKRGRIFYRFNHPLADQGLMNKGNDLSTRSGLLGL